MRSSLLMSCVMPGLLAGCLTGSDEGLNNGERGEISMAMPGLPVEHQPFEITIFVQRQSAICGRGQVCVEDEPIVGMAAGCEDESICVVAQQDPVEEDRRCRVSVDAHQAGETRLLVEVETASGVIRRDVFPIRVTSPTSMEVTCAACDQGLAPGQEAEAQCRLYNRALSPDPLQGACDAVPMGLSVEVEGNLGMIAPADAQAQGPRFSDEAPAGARAFGNVFTVRKKLPQAAEVRFSAGEVEHRITAH
ncbi:MAG: hypothetical protein AB2A00_36250 [Myxococcota bacterium]